MSGMRKIRHSGVKQPGRGFAGASRLLLLAAVTLATLAMPTDAEALGFEDARHLLSRAGLSSPTPAEIAPLLPLSRDAAIRTVLAGARREAVTPLPVWADDPPPPSRKAMGRKTMSGRKMAGKDIDRTERMARVDARRERAAELKSWWFRELVATDSPLTERMALFWHNHFTSSLQKVRLPSLLLRQNRLFRKHGLGSFRALLHAIARDPAMLVYLDNAVSRAGSPNENFARELLELFTLGEGHYSEADIKAAARALTGWSVDRNTGKFRVYAERHDDGDKIFLGVGGKLDGNDIVEILLRQPRTAEFIAAKMWRAFVSTEPGPGTIERLAGRFREADYAIARLLEDILASDAFWDAANRGTLIKSPVELLVGTLRLFRLELPERRVVERFSGRMGQDLFDPPNVKGWPGGTAWITSRTLLLRQSLLRRFGNGRTMKGGGVEAWYLGLPRAIRSPAGAASLMLPIAPADPPVAGSDPYRLVMQLLLDPVYQLK